MRLWGQFGFPDAISPIIWQIIWFHDHAFLILLLVIIFVSVARISLINNTFTCRFIYDAQLIETVWTIVPALILILLALPSLRLLYLIDEISNPALTIKTIAHQWYWRYEYTDFGSVEFDSFILPESDLTPGQYRLLEVDNRTILPILSEIRIIITSADVIHSWAIPSLGVKVDAVPGRLNQIGFTTLIPGVFYGQCSEICGANHTFIPIALEIVNSSSFNNWVLNNCE